ncbi:MAG: AI-2E family transporter [Bacteroidota bacterium]|nr:MAG: AI-2E family transporter [Bacteroidota bacterium]
MLLLLIIITWCLLILFPFTNTMLWGLILAIALFPMHRSLTEKLKGNRKKASTLIILICLAIIIIPSLLFIDSIIEGIKELKLSYQAGTLSIPPPSEKVKSWPIIGERLYFAWQSGSSNLEQFVIDHKEKLAKIGSKIAQGLLGVTSGALQMVGAVIIAGIILAYSQSGESIRKFFRKASGSRGDEFADIVKVTVGNVVRGVLGVALIQSFLFGIGLLLAGVPFVGLWTLLVLVFSILQLPPTLIAVGMVIFLFSEKETMPALIWSIYLILAGASDNFLKPLLLGKGAPVPMLIIFLGVVGGFMLSGFIGLFSGAIVMSIGYKLFSSWLNSPETETNNKKEI